MRNLKIQGSRRRLFMRVVELLEKELKGNVRETAGDFQTEMHKIAEIEDEIDNLKEIWDTLEKSEETMGEEMLDENQTEIEQATEIIEGLLENINNLDTYNHVNKYISKPRLKAQIFLAVQSGNSAEVIWLKGIYRRVEAALERKDYSTLKQIAEEAEKKEAQRENMSKEAQSSEKSIEAHILEGAEEYNHAVRAGDMEHAHKVLLDVFQEFLQECNPTLPGKAENIELLAMDIHEVLFGD